MTVIKPIFDIRQNKQHMRPIETSLINLQNVHIYVLTRKHSHDRKNTTGNSYIWHVKSNLVPPNTRSQAIDRSLVLCEPAITQHEDITLGVLIALR